MLLHVPYLKKGSQNPAKGEEHSDIKMTCKDYWRTHQCPGCRWFQSNQEGSCRRSCRPVQSKSHR